jgi:hypothetical protein
MGKNLDISWFGRCCFLAEYDDKKVLFDPYDSYCGVDIGLIEADILVSSSTWHDHGHIGASPKAHIYSYPGEYENDGIKITGIEATEERGSPTVIFNVKMGGFSLTNFADFHSKGKEDFDRGLTSKQRGVLQSSNVIFARPSIVGNKITDNNVHNESFLEFCSPSIIIPEHYFPKSFIEEQVSEKLKKDFLAPHIVVDEMVEGFDKYHLEEINGYKITLGEDNLRSKKTVKFLKLHKQVKYIS